MAEFRGMTLEEALRFAVAASAASALSPGTGGMDPSDMERLLPEITVWKC